MQVTIELPENLAVNLQSHKGKLSQIFELGLREFKASSSIGYKSVADVLEFFAGLPAPDEILALRPSAEMEAKISELLEKNRREGLSETEEQIWASYEFIEHLVRIAKAKALAQLKK
ncbi:MAG: hypothetical protein LH472_04835 [Pyrinomonadaceae bacterium]|nr:hypothetical protein [Pyrinomonadaceae bacterium]